MVVGDEENWPLTQFGVQSFSSRVPRPRAPFTVHDVHLMWAT